MAAEMTSEFQKSIFEMKCLDRILFLKKKKKKETSVVTLNDFTSIY